MVFNATGVLPADGLSICFWIGSHGSIRILKWCRIRTGPLRRIEVLLNEREANAFIFRRDFRIVAPINRTFVRSNSGIRVLAPEIVLLYKSKGPTEPKEQQDFSNMVDALDMERRQWLIESISAIDPEHRWLAALRGPHSGQAS